MSDKLIINSWSIKIALVSFFEERVKKNWERNCMNLEMQPTLLNTHPPKTDSNDSEKTSEMSGWLVRGISTQLSRVPLDKNLESSSDTPSSPDDWVLVQYLPPQLRYR